jgi:hypothetical protein
MARVSLFPSALRGSRSRMSKLVAVLMVLTASLATTSLAFGEHQKRHSRQARHGRRHRHHHSRPPAKHGKKEPPPVAPPPGDPPPSPPPPQGGPPESAPPPPAPVPPALPDVGVAAGADLQTWTLPNVERELGDYTTLHAHWIRHDFAWDAIEHQRGVFSWTGFDRWVAAARSRSVNVIATLTYTPPWANGGSTDHRLQPSSPEQFGSFAGEVAGRYATQGLHTYEIWNEPNIGYWQPKPDPASYAKVLCSAYREIHAADPQATVLTGGTSPAADSATSYSPQTWLSDLYANGAGSCFDAVAHHPYVDSSSTPGSLGNAWNLMYSAYPSSNLRAIMAAHGDAAKRVWATEVGCNREALGDAECSTRISKALKLWQSFSWAGVLCWFTYWDPNAYGLVDGAWAPRPEWYAFRSAASSYS